MSEIPDDVADVATLPSDRPEPVVIDATRMVLERERAAKLVEAERDWVNPRTNEYVHVFYVRDRFTRLAEQIRRGEDGDHPDHAESG